MTGIDVDPAAGHIYWSVANGIYRANLDGTGVTGVITSGLSAVEAIALDTAAGQMYWIQSNANKVKINRAKLDGTSQAVLVDDTFGSSFNQNARDLEIDTRAGRLYFTSDLNGAGAIDIVGAVNTDGTNARTLYTSLTTPYGLAINLNDGRLYWADSTGINQGTFTGDASSVVYPNLTGITEIEIPAFVEDRVGTFDADRTISVVPLVDTYEPSRLRYLSASIPPTSVNTTTGTITWSNIGPINADAMKTIYVSFEVLEPASNASGVSTVNTANVTNAVFANGLPASNDQSSVTVAINPTASIGDQVWRELNSNTTYTVGTDAPLPGVKVELRDSSGSSVLATTYTDSSGKYLFSGLVVPEGTLGGAAGTATYQVWVTAPAGATCIYDATHTGGGSCDGKSTVTLSNAYTSLASNPGPTDNLNQDVGYTLPNSLVYGNVWRDYNTDGTRATLDPGIGSVTVRLMNGSTVVATTTTDSQGRYSFTNVATGSYTVEVLTSSLPSSGTWTQTAENDATINNSISVSIASAGIYGAHDFGYGLAGTASVGDEVFIDLDQDNVKDAVDEGIRNISLSIYLDTNRDGVLDPTVDPVVKTTSTNSSGIYGFSGLTSGSYIVVLDTSDADFPAGLSAVSENPKSFSVLEGQSLTNVDFGFFPGDLGSISGQVWHDLDLDATPDGSESGLPSVLVSLYVDLNGDGTFQLLSTTSSSSTGGYSFTGLPYASYRVVVDTADADLPTSDGRVYSATTDSLYLRTLSSASPSATVNFGFAGLPAIGDFVYYDANRSGSQDAFESGIGGVTVRLFADANLDGVADGAALATTTTATGSGSDPVGFYQFTNVDPGNYLVVVDTATLPYSMVNSGDPDRDGVPWLTSADTTADYPASDSRDTGIVLSYSTYTGADFGYVPRGTIGDRVWRDQNANGVVDAGEVGIGGVTVTATSGAQTFTTTTDADGYYAFANLSAGTWTVSISGSPLSGLAATYDADGGLDSSTSVTIDGTGAVTNAFGSLGVDFGLRLNGSYSLSGSVCSNDARTSGICDDVDNLLDDQSDGDVGATDETELSGQTVYLYQKVSSTYRLVATTTTDETGDYRFENLPNGDYKVVLSATSVELQNTQLTTTAADTPATVITDLGTSIVQEVAISGADVTGVDFAFDSLVSYDFGDLPAYYVATTRDVDGARHIIPVGSTLYLGTSRDADIDGVASLDASFDDGSGTDDEDGVVPLNIGSWTNGTAGGSVQVTVPSGSTGYLVGWIDFNHDGSLIDLGELVISQSVTGTGSAQTIAFDIPAGTITNLADESWLARFRLFPAAPAYPLFAYTGEASDGEVEDHLFQRFRQSSLGDRVWLDADADGVQDSGEWGIPGITVVLKDGSGNVLDTQVTGDGSTDVDGDGVIDAVGYYRFDGRTAGTYTVELTIPSKYAATYDPDNGTASPNGSATHVLTSNTHDTNVDFGLNAPVLADISGTVYFDANHDNAFGSGDTGLGAVTVQLWTDPNGDGDPSDGELVNEVLTRTDGSYRFEDMPAYSYVVVEVDPEDYVSDSDVAGAPTDNRIPVVLGVVDVTGRNFLDDGDVLHAIQGTVYNDNGVGVSTNNQFNAADTALAGVTVTLYLDADGDGVVGATDPSVDTQVTASNGGYSFPYLPDGNYLVVESDPTGFSSDDDTQGAGTDNLIAVTLAGADSTGNNFLDDEPTVSIGGTVWNDEGTGASADYTFSAGDTVIVGVTVELYEDTNQDGALDTGDVLLATVTTDVNGEYIFTGLYPGHYLVVETDPTGFLSDNDTQGHGLDNTIAVALGASDSVGNDFLDDELPVSLSGTVFNDDGTGASTDDTFDAADTVISGVTVDLYLDVNGDGAVDAGDPLVAVLTTDSNGDYSFTGLYAGDYLVVETDPTGFVSDLDTDGSATDNLIAVTLVVSDSTGNDFLDDEQVMTIRGTVFNDNGIGASANDAFNAADTRISGVTLKLYLDVNADGQLGSGDTLLATVATDSNGDYSFTGLYAGRYLVVETDPTGFGSDNDTQGVGTDNLIAVALSVGDSTGNDFLDDEQSGPVAVNDARYNLLPGPATLRSSSNDSDPNNLLDIGSVDLNPSSSGRQITLVVPNEGTWKVDNLGWVTFFPQAGFTLDPAPIPYTIRNTPGAVSNQATITLDYAPRATNDSSFGNAIGTAVTLAVVGNDLGGDTANPTTVKIHGTTNPGDPLVVPGQGTWSVNSTTGAITFTPQTGFTGDPQPIRYTVKDYQGNDSNAAVVTVDYVAPCTGFPLMLAIDDLSTPGIDHIVVDDSPVGTSTSLGPSNRLDAAATARGQLSFSGSTAKFSFVKIVATSKPFLTLAGGPDIQITASFRSSASGQIAVRATDGCYAVTAGSPYTMFSPIGGTTNGRVVFRETANGSNLPFATTGVTNNYTTPVAGSFSAGPNRSALFSAPYVSLTKQLNVTHSKANQLTTLTAGGKLVESRLAAEYRSQLAWALARTVFARPEWIWGTQSLVSRGLPLPTVAGVLPGGPRQVEAITTAIQPPMEESAMSHSASEKLNRNAALAVDQVMGVWGDLGDF